MKNISFFFFLSENFPFLVKFSIYLNRLVFVMNVALHRCNVFSLLRIRMDQIRTKRYLSHHVLFGDVDWRKQHRHVSTKITDFEPGRVTVVGCVRRYVAVLFSEKKDRGLQIRKTLFSLPTDLDLHCLHTQGISGSSRSRFISSVRLFCSLRTMLSS